MGDVLTFDAALRNGIRKDSRIARNTQALDSCINLRTTEYGLKDFIAINEPISAAQFAFWSVSKAWPHPQLFRGKSETLLFEDTKVWAVIENPSSTWTLGPIITYDFADWTSTKAITGDAPWHFMDFYGTWMAFNGTCVVFKTAWSTKTFVQDDVTILTGCDFKEGRAFMGGFDTDDFWSSAWQTFLSDYQDNIPQELTDYIDNTKGADGNWVWWSTIGGGDLLWLFSSYLMTYNSLYGASGTDLSGETPNTGYDTTTPYLMDLLKLNQAGLRPMPWRGDVLQIRSIGESVVVYGEDGIAALVPFSNPTPTMGLREITGIGTSIGLGPSGRSAAGGSSAGHCLIDERGDLWVINPDLTANRLGYNEIFGGMTPANIVVSYDAHEKEFWIGDGTDCYVLTPSGLSRAPQIPTTVFFAEGGACGVVIEPAETDAVEVITHEFDGGHRAIWELTTVRLATTDTDAAGWTVKVDWRTQKSVAWERTSAVTVDQRGVAWVKVTGTEFRLVLEHPDRTKADLERIEVELTRGGKKVLTRVAT